MAENGPTVDLAPRKAPTYNTVVSPELMTAPARQLEQGGNALLRASSAVTDIGLHLQAQEDAVQVMSAETELKNRYLQFHTEAKARLGGNAWGLAQETGQWFEKQKKEINPKLSTERQQRMFAKSFDQVSFSGKTWAADHELAQRLKYTEETARASVIGSINIAAANPYDANVIGSAKKDIASRIETLSRLNGWDPIRRDTEVAEQTGNLHSQVIQNMLAAKDSKGAKEYYESNKAEIPGSKRDGIIKALEVGNTMRVAQEFADSAEKKKLTEPEAVALAREKLEGADEQHAIIEIKTRFGEAAKYRERIQRDAADAAWAIYGRTGNVADIPPDVIAKMDGRDYAQILRDAALIADRRLRKAEHESNKSDGEVLHALYQALPTEAFRDLDMRRYKNDLSPADFKHFESLQAQMKAKPEKIAAIGIDTDRFNAVADRAGMNPFKPSKNEEEKRALGLLRSRVEQQIELAQQPGKPPLTAVEKDVIAQRVVNEKVIQERTLLWNKDLLYSQVKPEDAAKILIPIKLNGKDLNVRLSDISPAASRALALEFLTKTGYPATINDIAEMYTRRKLATPAPASRPAPGDDSGPSLDRFRQP